MTERIAIDCPVCGKAMGTEGVISKTTGNRKWFCNKCKTRWTSYSIQGFKKDKAMSLGKHKCGLPVNNTSGFKGVSFHSGSGKFRSAIAKDKQLYYLGSFTNPIDAAIAYNLKAKELYGDHAYQNDIFQERNPKDYEYGTKGPAIEF